MFNINSLFHKHPLTTHSSLSTYQHRCSTQRRWTDNKFLEAHTLHQLCSNRTKCTLLPSSKSSTRSAQAEVKNQSCLIGDPTLPVCFNKFLTKGVQEAKPKIQRLRLSILPTNKMEVAVSENPLNCQMLLRSLPCKINKFSNTFSRAHLTNLQRSAQSKTCQCLVPKSNLTTTCNNRTSTNTCLKRPSD